jgi:hypothetical protein
MTRSLSALDCASRSRSYTIFYTRPYILGERQEFDSERILAGPGDDGGFDFDGFAAIGQ